MEGSYLGHYVTHVLAGDSKSLALSLCFLATMYLGSIPNVTFCLTTHPKAMEVNKHGLKPLELWAKIYSSFLKLFTSGISSQQNWLIHQLLAFGNHKSPPFLYRFAYCAHFSYKWSHTVSGLLQLAFFYLA